MKALGRYPYSSIHFALILALAFADAALAQTAPKPELVFASDRPGRLQIWKVQPDPLGTQGRRSQMIFAKRCASR